VFLEPRRRSEQAIVAVVLEAYVNGVSTRKVDRLVEQLGIDGMTKDRVSAMCRALDKQVELFRGRPLEGAYPYLWLDAKQVKVRGHGPVVSKAVVVAYAVHETGVRGSDRPGRRRGRVRRVLGRVCARARSAAWTACAWRSPIGSRE
jgi:putative transposase